MTEQEAQQAQAIAEIRNRNAQRGAWIEDCRLSDESSEQACYDCNDLLEIVDSQAQKIAEQAKEIERLKTTKSNEIPASTIMEFVEYFKVKLEEYPHTKENARLLLENLTHKFVQGLVDRGEIHMQDAKIMEIKILQNVKVG